MEAQELGMTIIDNSIEVFRGGAQILVNNQNRAAKALKVADSVIADWNNAYAIEDPDERAAALAKVDERSNKLLVNSRTAKQEMTDDRKEITTVMDTIKSMFTEQENLLDPKTGKLFTVQNYRNNYAKWLIEEQRRQEKLAQDKLNKANEEASIREQVAKYVSQKLLLILSEKIAKMTAGFNGITLADYEVKSEKLKAMVVDLAKPEFSIFELPRIVYSYHTRDEADLIAQNVITNYDYDTFLQTYRERVAEKKQELIDKLPSKKMELDEAEAARVRAEEEERKRQEQIQKTRDAAKKKQLEEEAERKRKADEQERIRLEQERINREQEEQNKLQREAEQRQKDAEEKIAMDRAAAEAEAQFTSVVETADISAAAPAAKKGYVVKVLHVAGWALLFEFWFKREGAKIKPEDADDLDKKTFKQLRAFAEKMAKDGEMIESKFITYTEEVKVLTKK